MGSSFSGVLRGSDLELRICVLRADPLAARSDSVLVTPPALHLQQSQGHWFSVPNAAVSRLPGTTSRMCDFYSRRDRRSCAR